MTPRELPTQSVVIGRLVEMEESYPREVAVPRGVVLAILAVGALFRLILSAVRAAGDGPSWKELRKGPEYLVTPVRVRDRRGRLVALEIHGYLSANALHVGDQVRIRVRRQPDDDLPPLGYHISNLTTGQILTPKPPTLWFHLGPDVLLQAVLGLLLAVVVVGLCAWGLIR